MPRRFTSRSFLALSLLTAPVIYSLFVPLAVLDAWVTSGKAPERISATHVTEGKTDRTRPLCVFPKVAKWNGTGSTDDATNFSCSADTAVKSTR